MPSLKVLICGGGIAGPALAYWLSSLGHDVTVVERFPDLRASGQQIDLRGQGVRVMRRMGIEKAVRAKVVDEAGIRFVTPNDREKAVFLANKTGKGKQSFTSEFEIMRGDLCRILYDASMEKNRVQYIFGVRMDSFEEREGGVDVKLSNGTEDRFDLVIGADGQNSRTRSMMLGPDAPETFKFLGLYCALFTIPRIESDLDYGTVCHFPGRRSVMTRADNPKTIQAYLSVVEKPDTAEKLDRAFNERTVGLAQQQENWAHLFGDAGWQTPRILDQMLNSETAADFYGYKVGQVKTDTWSKGRVVLLGDAGYCPSPMSGFGTSAALIGAYILAGELANHTTDEAVDIPSALSAYDTKLRPLIDIVQKLPPGAPGLFHPNSRWGIWVLHTILGLVQLLRLDKLGQYFSDDVSGWDLPDYPALDNMAG